ncbi:cytochrome P450 [Streptomyces californicus]|uniref:cytochrome P450 family protein n=1 Tax=Streptomyces californicus TaxID=67351 RepID=UPI00296E9C5B|nr:cytochrome P450 [Streptomyces californicus]MDW4912648.1 cytochrome P450 [Streptomyces californicus]
MDTQERTAAAPNARCPYRLDVLATDLHEENESLRARGPATTVELPGGVLARSVTDLGLARRLMRDPRVSKDPRKHWPVYASGELPEQWPYRIWVDIRNALASEGEEHARLRQLISPAFTPRRVRQLQPDIESLVEKLLNELAGLPEGQVDLRHHLAWVFPLQVVNLMLGVPNDMEDRFRHLVGANMATHYTAAEAAANGKAYVDLLTELIHVKRQLPADDITTQLVQQRDSDVITQQELIYSLMLLIGAGHETTMNALDHAIVNLLAHPDQLALVRAGHAPWDAVIDETLRHEAPVANILLRFAVEQIDDPQTGTTIAQGEAIIINVAAAGRDPRANPAPAVFDITRFPAGKHIAFGHGVHYCLGAELARMELRIALDMLFSRFPDISLAVPRSALKPQPSFISNGHLEIPVILGKDAEVIA